MTHPLVSIASKLSVWRWAIVLALSIAGLRALYVMLWCPYPLIEDEAHYWEWARRLDWSYYSKGPGIAALIWLTTSAFGDTEGAIRLGAVLGGLLTSIGVAGLARDIVRKAGKTEHEAGLAACGAVLCVSLTPLFQLPAMLSTIDSPYLACWALSSWAGWRALSTGSWSSWALLGLGLAIGFVFKYTILLIVPGLVLFALLARARPKFPRVGVCFLIASLGLVPVAIWNAQNEWSTVRHLMGHLGLAGGDQPSDAAKPWSYNPGWTIELLGIQLGGLLFAVPLIVLGAIAGLKGLDRAQRQGTAYALCIAGPIIVFYVLVTVFTRAEGNWPIAGHLTLLSLAGWAAARALEKQSPRIREWLRSPTGWKGVASPWPESIGQFSVWAMVVAGVIVATAMVRIDLFTGAFAAATGSGVSISRLTGAERVAREVDGVLGLVEASTGERPFVISQHYGRASQLAFYLPGRPIVYSASSLTGGRKSQYDMWSDTNLADLSTLGGKNAVLLGARREQWLTAFERVEELRPLPSDHKQRSLFVGYNYLGFGRGSDRGFEDGSTSDREQP